MTLRHRPVTVAHKRKVPSALPLTIRFLSNAQQFTTENMKGIYFSVTVYLVDSIHIVHIIFLLGTSTQVFIFLKHQQKAIVETFQ